MSNVLVNALGSLLIITGLFDAYKYVLQGRKIAQAQSAKNFSRRFINYAILNCLVKMLYGFSRHDVYLIATSIFAWICMLYMGWQMYLYYPYRHRHVASFRRPNLILYIINSILPNTIRRRL